MYTEKNDKKSQIELPTLTINLGPEELIIHKRYEALSITNDILIGIWFLIGSIFFLYTSLTHAGTILFIIGSIEMLIRPIIRLSRIIHLQKINKKKLSALPPDLDF